jgi:diadenosine tetraphosphate (Ap4A) HIT family hydrolase
MKTYPRRVPTQKDKDEYRRRSQEGPCFICSLLAGDPEYRHHIITQDEVGVAFLNRYPVEYGYVLVAPIQHREAVTEEFSEQDYLALQSMIYRVGRALQRVVPTERLYLLSLGSQQGNRHVHWHLVPLPPGVPYEKQQLAALDIERGILQIPENDMAALAARICEAIETGD